MVAEKSYNIAVHIV